MSIVEGNGFQLFPYVYPTSGAVPLPWLGEPTAASAARPQIMPFGKANTSGTTLAFRLTVKGSQVYEPHGSQDIAFKQGTSGAAVSIPWGSLNSAFAQTASAALRVAGSFKITSTVALSNNPLNVRPWGDNNSAFAQDASNRMQIRLEGSTLPTKPLGDDALPFAQGSGGILQVQNFFAAPTGSTAIGVPFTMVRAVMSTAETVHFTGTAGQKYQIDLIHLGNTAGTDKRASVYLTNGAAGSVATQIVPSLKVKANEIMEMSGPFVIASTATIRASTATTAVVQMEVTGRRIV